MLDTAVVDVDGTLVDSTYHHLLAWSRAFDAVGLVVPGHRLHACMGMGGDHLVAAAAGEAAERAVGDEVRHRWRAEYDELLPGVRALPGAVDLLEAFRRHGVAVVLATSGEEDHVDRTLEILELGPDDYPLVSSGDVDATKPAGDLVDRAVDRVGGNTAVLIGDTVWDVAAGRAAGVPVVGVLTGGIAPERLRESGAIGVHEDVGEVRDQLDHLLEQFARTHEAGG